MSKNSMNCVNLKIFFSCGLVYTYGIIIKNGSIQNCNQILGSAWYPVAVLIILAEIAVHLFRAIFVFPR